MEDFTILKPFSPTVIKIKIPEKIILDLNNYIDQIVENEKKSSELDHGNHLVGDVTQEFKLGKDIMEKVDGQFFLLNVRKNGLK
jgi:hypothetical protein